MDVTESWGKYSHSAVGPGLLRFLSAAFEVMPFTQRARVMPRRHNHPSQP